ncbi:MAG: hypothetical protein OQK48_09330 [Sulfurimonas sp.]|uniref:hypothetical protein n=1 Tax=Sulfurimonas sp. TaxID=2022749 RepID=UPI00262D1001|nr:hypothetical protein [Sulfurimonas sp.]MCW8894720.1 hypothetical protein [Sulfurimonas sp.]MCW8955127.1 hypothetical protein [Sulfurimonas sp.]MCW9066921.1 hypothetical protein [Sulfurimonas sp.]
MIKKIKIELIYFTCILIILALFQHSDLLTSPLARIDAMVQKENYFHPLLWTSIVYLVVGLVRFIVKFLFYLKNRNKS